MRGEGFVKDFQEAVSNPDISLSDLGRKHGFSRERASKIFKKINGFSYSTIRPTKSNALKNQIEANRIDPDRRINKSNGDNNVHTGIHAEHRFYSICKDKGFSITPLHHLVDYLVNHKMIEVKSASLPVTVGGKRKYYHFGPLTKSEWDHFELLACYLKSENSFYIIPRDELRGNHGIYIPDPQNPVNGYGSRFSKYREAWHLLQ